MEEVPKKLMLNQMAISLAKQLIKDGKVNREEDNWPQNKPTTEIENAFLAEHEMKEYGHWFLVEVADTDPETKGHYELPFGNFKELFKSGLMVAKQRAVEFKNTEIEQAIDMLLALLEEQ